MNNGGFKYDVGIGYIAIPTDLDRATYIADCYKNYHVSIKTEDGGFLNRVPITPDTLNFIEFPETINELGTTIQYITDEEHQTVFINSRFANREQIGDGKEHAFSFRRKYKERLVEVSGSSKDGSLNFIVNGGSTQGQLHVVVTDKKKDSRLRIDVSGLVEVNSKVTKLSQIEEFSVTTGDDENSSSFVQTSSENKFYGQKLVVNDGDKPIALGDEVKTFLGNFITELAKTTVAGAPLDNALKILAFKTKLDKIASKEAFLKK